MTRVRFKMAATPIFLFLIESVIVSLFFLHISINKRALWHYSHIHFFHYTFLCLDERSLLFVADPESDPSKTWMCDDGELIPRGRRCDGQVDCADVSDEHYCGVQTGNLNKQITNIQANLTNS